MVVAKRAHVNVPQFPRHQPQPRRHVRPKNKLDVQLLYKVITSLIIVGLALLVVYRYGVITQNNFEIRQLRQIRSTLVDEQHHLEIRIAQLTSLERLESIARSEMGLNDPRPEQIKFLDQ
ncbi:MAG: hypothetical protein FH749_06030 [Firmicutes bacterium]|nr:hypothetical protein [Bacillota bacterium]